MVQCSRTWFPFISFNVALCFVGLGCKFSLTSVCNIIKNIKKVINKPVFLFILGNVKQESHVCWYWISNFVLPPVSYLYWEYGSNFEGDAQCRRLMSSTSKRMFSLSLPCILAKKASLSCQCFWYARTSFTCSSFEGKPRRPVLKQFILILQSLIKLGSRWHSVWHGQF